MLNKITLHLICFIVGGLLGRAIIPRVETKEVIKYVKIIEEKKQQDKNKTVVITETKSKDGTIKKETTIKESSVAKTETKQTVLNEDIAIKKETTKGITVGLIGISHIDKNMLTNRPQAGIITSVPVIGSLSLAGMITTDKQLGIGLTIEF